MTATLVYGAYSKPGLRYASTCPDQCVYDANKAGLRGLRVEVEGFGGGLWAPGCPPSYLSPPQYILTFIDVQNTKRKG